MPGKKKILIIEDSNLVSSILKSQLREKGFEVSIAFDGKTGLQKTREEKPDIIILDLILPGLPGEEVCKEIKKDEQTKTIPIIMLTAKDSDADKVVGRVIGADLYMPKPFDINQLIREVDRLIGS
jgi:DNA-binding response OmpR family regulator